MTKSSKLKLSVVTPVFNGMEWLPLCAASVADQGIGSIEHIVQDGGSTDGTVEWAAAQPNISFATEPDGGMYDALNKAIARSTGDVILHLNCDEQLLPGIAARALAGLQDDLSKEVIFGDALVVDGDGELMAYRKTVLPHWFMTAAHTLPTLTCTAFIRRSVFTERNLYFDIDWRDLGDKKWIMDAIDADVSMGLLHQYSSAFVNTGENMNFSPNAMAEKERFKQRYPAYYRWLCPLVKVVHRANKWRSGCYRQDALDYNIYTRAQGTGDRVAFHVTNPTYKNPFPPEKA